MLVRHLVRLGGGLNGPSRNPTVPRRQGQGGGGGGGGFDPTQMIGQLIGGG